MHPYLKLCIKTWEKFLPDYEIVILDYSNLDRWLGKDFYPKNLWTDFSLPKQADAVRCAVLRRYGGVWMDTDTIITSSKCQDIFNIDSEIVLFGMHIGFIVAKKNAYILRKWERRLQRKIRFYKWCRKSKRVRKLFAFFEGGRERLAERLERWDYLGNSILNKMLLRSSLKRYAPVDREKAKALPEVVYAKEHDWAKESAADPVTVYRKFYFENDFVNYALHDNQGIIYLHNSWTPDSYKRMSEKEFLNQDITLSNILRRLLDNQQ